MSISHPAADPGAAAPAPSGAAQSQTIGYIFAAIGAILFSTKAVAIKLAYQEQVSAETLLALRMLLSLPFYAAIGLWSIRDRVRTGRPLPSLKLVAGAVAVGLLGYWISSYLDFMGLVHISAQIERMILFTYPIFVVILGALFFGQRVSRRALMAIGVSYAGLALIFTHDLAGGGSNALIGGLLVLGCAVTFALYQLFAKPLIGRIGPRLFTCIAMSAAAAGAIGQFLVSQPPGAILVSPRLWAISLFLAIGSTVLPSFFLNAALHRISPQANATIGTLSPVATIILAFLILGEMLSPTAWVGTALVLAGVGWYTLAERR
jgi:drug/metabolite transporter (DMT)-like permease